MSAVDLRAYLAFGLGFLSAAALSSCKTPAKAGSAVRANEHGAAPSPFAATDVSILFPLKPVAATGANDPYRIVGDGFANAPHLSLGGDDPVLSQTLFTAFTSSVYGRARRDDAPTPEQQGTCRSPLVAAELVARGDKDLLTKDVHLSVVRMIDSRACAYDNWRIVGFRFDPCLELPLLGGQLPPGKLPAACQTAEARLIAQPFVYADGAWSPLDMTMHLIYAVPDQRGLVQGLHAIQKATQLAMSAAAWDSDDGDPHLLRPHPGLRAEMGQSGGPVATAIADFFQHYTRESLLTGIAWMTSAQSQAQWTFGVRKIVQRSIAAESSAESFSLSVLNAKTFPFTPLDASSPNIGAFFTSDWLTGPFPLQALDDPTGVLDDIQNPLKVSQVLAGEHGSTCVSCHLTEQTLRQAALALGKEASYPGRDPYTGFAPDASAPRRWSYVKDRIQGNLRNFGYGPAFAVAISRRASNETEAIAAVLNKYDGAYADALQPRDATVQHPPDPAQYGPRSFR